MKKYIALNKLGIKTGVNLLIVALATQARADHRCQPSSSCFVPETADCSTYQETILTSPDSGAEVPHTGELIHVFAAENCHLENSNAKGTLSYAVSWTKAVTLSLTKDLGISASVKQAVGLPLLGKAEVTAGATFNISTTDGGSDSTTTTSTATWDYDVPACEAKSANLLGDWKDCAWSKSAYVKGFYYPLQQAALTRKADLLLQSTNLSVSDRRAAEAILGPLTEIKNSGPFSEMQGQLTSARIQNFKEIGDFGKASEMGERFIKSNPHDLFAPLIADELCTLTNHYAPSKTLELWVGYFVTNGATRSAAFANLKLDLMNAYAREQLYEKAAQIGQELQNFKKDANDPLPWGEPEQSSVTSVTTVTKGEIEREKSKGILPVRTPEEEKKTRTVILVFLALITFVPLFIMAFAALKKRNFK